MRYLRSMAAFAAATTTTIPVREGGTLDRITTVAAIGSIALVAVAGIYIYLRIRKGL